MAQEVLKCGNRWHGKMQIPINADIKTSPAGRDYYVSGIDLITDYATIKYTDTGEYKQVNRKLV